MNVQTPYPMWSVSAKADVDTRVEDRSLGERECVCYITSDEGAPDASLKKKGARSDPLASAFFSTQRGFESTPKGVRIEAALTEGLISFGMR